MGGGEDAGHWDGRRTPSGPTPATTAGGGDDRPLLLLPPGGPRDLHPVGAGGDAPAGHGDCTHGVRAGRWREMDQAFIDHHRPDAVRILDWPHATSYLAAVARALYGQDTPAANAWLAQQKATLLHGEPALVLAVLADLQAALMPVANGQQERVVWTLPGPGSADVPWQGVLGRGSGPDRAGGGGGQPGLSAQPRTAPPVCPLPRRAAIRSARQCGECQQAAGRGPPQGRGHALGSGVGQPDGSAADRRLQRPLGRSLAADHRRAAAGASCATTTRRTVRQEEEERARRTAAPAPDASPAPVPPPCPPALRLRPAPAQASTRSRQPPPNHPWRQGSRGHQHSA